MAPRKKNTSIKSTGSTSSKAEPLPDWVKNKSLAKPPPKFQQQQQKGQPAATSSSGEKGTTTDNVPVRPPPLFPPGTKTPINLLNERIQKHHAPKGWLKPSIDARRAPRGYGKQTDEAEENHEHTEDNQEERWTFVVTLTKTNKSDQSNPFIVRFDARDPSGHEGSTIVLDSKEKAKHWGATYALFRLCSNLSLDSILPTGPREYWKVLASNKAKAPEHLNWLWQADPFEASQKMQSEKEAKRVAREKKELEAESGPRLPKAWLEAREIRMAKGMRDMIEETVRQALEVFPMQEEDTTIEGMNDNDAPSSGVATPTRAVPDAEELSKKLQKLGFRKGYAQSAVRWLSAARQGQSSSAAAASLKSISKLSDEDACLEYLSIFCPEDDLPAAFAPSRKADSFVTNSSSTAVKGDGLALRWIEERIFKNAGYPREAVRSALSSCEAYPVEVREAACLEILLLQLVHLTAQSHLDSLKQSTTPSDDITQYRADERMALEAVLGPERVIDISPSERPLTSQKRDAGEMFDIIIAKKPDDDIRLRICPGDISRYPIADKTAMPTFFVASTTLPAYLRLAMTQRLGRCLTGQESGREDWMEMLESGQGGIILAMVEELETCWKKITEEPPELSEVMAGVVISKAKKAEPKTNAKEITPTETSKSNRRGNKLVPVKPLVNNAGKNEELKSAQAQLHHSSAYAPIKEARIQLPAMASSGEIVSLLDKHRLLIIAGETGCGKTTQCPQFILDNMIESGKGSMCNIIVTQPRRLSAMGVASRVAQERCEELNGQGLIGYAIRGESKSGRNTKLLFTTTGVLLRRLSTNDPDLLGISHVFVDEVHERGVDSDLLLIELREVLKRNPTLRVILMSATIERETFVNYFNNVPTMDIPGRTFPVQDYYLEDVRSMLGQNDQNNEEEEEDSKSRKKNQGIDYDLIGQTVDMICKRADQKKDTDGGILVFLPGVGEIRQAIESIERATSRPVDVFPLHANLSPEDQRKVFKKPRSGSRKVVVSTNVAETSITIDDIVYVVDIGLVKETRYDVQSGLTKLVETRCSKANARQRRGRAGRVRPGECFKLFTRGTEQYRMEDQQIPEMRRMSLENLILSVKALKGDSVPVQSYLLSAISPPSLDAIEQAVQLLNDMNVLVTDQQRLTALGKHLALLPLDVRLGKLLILSCVFRCLKPMLTAAAILSCKPLFNAPFEKRQEASKARKQLTFGSSDILTDVNAYHQWLSMRKNGNSNAEIRSWCEDHFISPSALRDISSTRQDLLANLVEMGLVSAQYRSEQNSAVVSSLDKNSEQVNLQRALLLAALYPSVVRITHPQAKYDKAIGGAVEREAEAKQVRFFDSQNQRVFLHPSSILFDTNKYASDFLASFRRGASQSQNKGASGDKIYLRDATEVPMFALLLFGGHLRVHRKEGGISIGNGKSATADSGWIKLRAGGRIVALVNQLRFLLDAALAQSFENPLEDVFGQGKENDTIESKVLNCLHQLLERDGQ